MCSTGTAATLPDKRIHNLCVAGLYRRGACGRVAAALLHGGGAVRGRRCRTARCAAALRAYVSTCIFYLLHPPVHRYAHLQLSPVRYIAVEHLIVHGKSLCDHIGSTCYPNGLYAADLRW